MSKKLNEKLLSGIITLLVINLAAIVFLSFIPLINETIPSSSPDFDKFADMYIKKYAEGKENVSMNLYLSINSMAIRNSKEVKDLFNKASLILYLLWVNVAICVISAIGTFFYFSKEKEKIAYKLVSLGILSFLIGILLIISEIYFMLSVNSYSKINLAAIGSAESFIKYFYINVLITLILIVYSFSFFRNFLILRKENKRLNAEGGT